MKKDLLVVFVILALAFAFSLPVLAQELTNPTRSFASDLPTFILHIFKIIGAIIGAMTIVMVVFAGFRMVMSQGNEEEITKSKLALQWTLAGFVLTLFAFVIINAISAFIGARNIDIKSYERPQQVINPVLSPTFADLTDTMVTGLLGLIGLISLVMIIVSGFKYITAQGNEEQTTQAKNGLLWSIVGLMIVALGYVIVVATARLFGG